MQPVPTEDSVCPVCGPAPSQPRFAAIDRLHGLPGEYRYSRCAGCGLLFMNPRVRPEAAVHVYPQTYQPHAKSTVRSSSASMSARALRWLRGTNLPGYVTRELGPETKVLDVGFGAGEFLNELRGEYGCQVFGLDLSEAAVAYAREHFEIDAVCGTLETAPWAPHSFDLITSWWSLEHMPDPERALGKIRELLRPGGHVLIAVPNSRSAVAKVFGSRWYHLDCPRHYHLWTPSSLRQLLERQGLTHVSTSLDKSPWGLLGSLQYVVFQDNHHPESANRLRGNVKMAPLFLPLTFALGMLRYSDAMVMVARKPEA